jgi:hypothetical protein
MTAFISATTTKRLISASGVLKPVSQQKTIISPSSTTAVLIHSANNGTKLGAWSNFVLAQRTAADCGDRSCRQRSCSNGFAV